MTTLTAATAREGWLTLLRSVRAHGRTYLDQDKRECREVLNVVLSITDPHDTLELVRDMQKQPDWVYPSAEELKSIVLDVSGQGAHDYSYVPRLFGGVNQVEQFIIPLLQANPQSRRAVATLYNPEHDSKVTSKNVPGLLSLHFRVIEQLEVTCHIRSNDVFIGYPANIYQVRCLQEFIAQRLGVYAGSIHLFSTSAHYFSEYSTIIEKALRHKE